MYCIRHIPNSGIFSTVFFRNLSVYPIIFRLIKAYSAPSVTLAYSQSCHTLSPGICRTRNLFETLLNVDQTYIKPCHRALFSHIYTYSEPCPTLAYADPCHTRNPGIFRTLPQLYPGAYSEPCYIYENLRIFRTMTFLKPDIYLEPSKRFNIELFAKIVKNYDDTWSEPCLLS